MVSLKTSIIGFIIWFGLLRYPTFTIAVSCFATAFYYLYKTLFGNKPISVPAQTATPITAIITPSKPAKKEIEKPVEPLSITGAIDSTGTATNTFGHDPRPYWEGPYGIRVPMHVRSVLYIDGVNGISRDGYRTLMASNMPAPSPEEYFAKYTFVDPSTGIRWWKEK